MKLNKVNKMNYKKGTIGYEASKLVREAKKMYKIFSEDKLFRHKAKSLAMHDILTRYIIYQMAKEKMEQFFEELK